MAKKKGKGKKGAKKEGQSEGEEGQEGGTGEQFNDVTREVYKTKINDLEQKVERYVEKCNQLDSTNKQLEETIEQQVSDKKEIVLFIKKQLKEKSEELFEIEKQLRTVENAHYTDKMSLELEIAQIKSKNYESLDQLMSANTVLNGKLTATEEFRQNKDIIMKKQEKLEGELKSQAENHEKEIYIVERKAVVDREKIKKDMVLHLNELTNEFRELTHLHMADTTKRTIRENAIINSQLGNLSAKTIELLSENDSIRSNKKALQRTIEILEYNEKEMMKKNVTNKKLIMMMAKRSRAQDDVIEKFTSRDSKSKELETELSSLKGIIRNLKSAHNYLQHERDNLAQKCDHFKDEYEKLDGDHKHLVDVLSDATFVIGKSLEHDVTGIEECAAKTEKKNSTRLFKILEILNAAVEMGVGVSLTDFNAARERQKKLKENTFLGAIAEKKKTIYSEIIKPRPHYEMGDLDIVPSPVQVFRNKTYSSQKKSYKERYGMYNAMPRELTTRSTVRRCKKSTAALLKLPSLT